MKYGTVKLMDPNYFLYLIYVRSFAADFQTEMRRTLIIDWDESY